MDKHIATLEKVYSRIKEGDFYDDYDDATKLLGEFREAIAAIALMRAFTDCPNCSGTGAVAAGDMT